MTSSSAPAVDVGVFRGLIGSMSDDADACLRFLDIFLDSLDDRVDRVRAAEAHPGAADALAALRGMATTADMVGASELAHASRHVIAAVADGTRVPPGAGDWLAGISQRARGELERLAIATAASPGAPTEGSTPPRAGQVEGSTPPDDQAGAVSR